jgi:hypothetical protein
MEEEGAFDLVVDTSSRWCTRRACMACMVCMRAARLRSAYVLWSRRAVLVTEGLRGWLSSKLALASTLHALGIAFSPPAFGEGAMAEH